VVVEPVPNTTAFRILAGGITLVGFIRQAADRGGVWIARSLGAPDGSTAASIRRFAPNERHSAITWLVEREPAPAEPGRSIYAASGPRKAAAQ
jgi:hypothetical protein